MRGAVDGLNVVVPYGEKDYYKMRPTIAIPAPGKPTGVAEAAIDLDGFFGFHPRLDALKPIFDQGQLAVIDAAGSPSNSRSHFEAQDFMETATPDVPTTRDGWLNRYLRYTPLPDPTPFRAVAASPRMPLTLEGPAHALAIGNLRDFKLRLNPNRPAMAVPLPWQSNPGILPHPPLRGALSRRARAGIFPDNSSPLPLGEGGPAGPGEGEAPPNLRSALSLLCSVPIQSLCTPKRGLSSSIFPSGDMLYNSKRALPARK